ncbi:hypothetical protein LF41_1197 [Lysobacter dokdonensis DS-58]|uniref:Uncharacterized protein n=1 Tax=Lysobacter dokdonensis DS-58 TaxID=1300345 RepID=A0A0A2X640_9GAMM|nr:hypothetical protein [Lysobacter dokdonensis]KGQ20659.1 hypothetical protein LF41_1197 [Lysobacter dokdonensis DS-58]
MATADGNGLIEGLRPFIPPGAYQMRLIDWKTVMYNGRQPKVVLQLAVCSNGYMGTPLERWYNATRLIGKVGRHGGFAAPGSGDLLFEYVDITGNSPRRSDRINLSHLGDRLLLGHVETVVKNQRQRVRPIDLRYSVVRRLEKATV